MSHVYVLVEHEDNVLNPVTGELITAARALGTVDSAVLEDDWTVVTSARFSAVNQDNFVAERDRPSWA